MEQAERLSTRYDRDETPVVLPRLNRRCQNWTRGQNPSTIIDRRTAWVGLELLGRRAMAMFIFYAADHSITIYLRLPVITEESRWDYYSPLDSIFEALYQCHQSSAAVYDQRDIYLIACLFQ